MSALGATLASLRLARGMGATSLPAGADRLQEITKFGSNPGALRAFCYVPRRLEANVPLVVVLHGCTQSAAGYDYGSGWSQLADREGFALLFPEQQRANNPNLCFNWFSPGDVTRGAGEVESIAQMVRTMLSTHSIDPQRVFVTGLSAGGAMSASLLATYPEMFSGGAIIAGLAHGVAATVPEAFERMRGAGLPAAEALQRRLATASSHAGTWPRVSIWQGSADRTVAPVNAEALVKQWQGVHGLEGAPDTRQTVDGARHRVWQAGGETKIETWEITGLGHGTPIAPGDDGLGHAWPYMLPAGVSSTQHIATFFGLMREVAKTDADTDARTDADEAKVLEPTEIATVPVTAPPVAPVAAAPVEVALVPQPVASQQSEPGKLAPEEKAARPESVAAYVDSVLEQALPGKHGLFASIKAFVQSTLRKSGLK